MKTCNVTLGRIIDAARAADSLRPLPDEVVKVIGAAYWAGQSDARAQERERNREAVESFELGRFTGLAAKAREHFDLGGAAEGLRQERDEFRDWDFELPRVDT